MKKVCAYLLILFIFIAEIVTYSLGYRFINTSSYFFVNGLLIFILVLLLKKKLLSHLPVKIFFILLVCFGFVLSDRIYIFHSPNSNSSLIIQEQSGFHDYMYTFYKKKFIFFKERIYGSPIVSNTKLDISSSFDVIWIDDNTVKLSPIEGENLIEQTISLRNALK